MSADRFSHHGVFAHEHDTRSTESDTNLLHLLGTHIVRANDKTFRIFVQQILKQTREIYKRIELKKHF